MSVSPQHSKSLFSLVAAAATIFLSSPAMAACPPGSVAGSTASLSSGDTCVSLDAGTDGVINAPGVTITGNTPASGISVNAHDGGEILFSASSMVDATAAAAGRGAMRASGISSRIDARDGTKITVRGAGDSVIMLNGGQVLLDGTSEIDVNSIGFGLIVDNTTTTLSDLVIQINGASATSFGNGLQTRNGGNITLGGSSSIRGLSSFTGAGAIQGIYAQSNGVVAVGPGAVDIELSNAKGQNVYGVNAITGGKVLGGHLNISVPNGNGYGFRALDPGTFIDGTNSHVELGATTVSAVAANMQSGGLVKLDGTSTVHSIGTAVPGLDNVGIKIDGTVVPDDTVGPGLTLVLDGTNGIGIWATVDRAYSATSVPSSVSVNGLTVMGPGGRLALAADAGSSISAANSTLTANANGQSSTAALLVRGGPVTNTDPTYVGGTIHLTDSTAKLLGTAGATAGGIRALSGDEGFPNVVHLDHSSVTTDSAPGITALGGLVDIDLVNGSQIIGGGGLLVQSIVGGTDPSFVNLSATDHSTWTGDAVVDAESTLNMTLSGDSLWTGAAHDVTGVTLGNPSTWEMNGSSTVGSLALAGKVRITPPVDAPAVLANYKSLAVQSLVGTNGSIDLSTYLGDDGSPSDRIVIDGGTATGTTLLRITNTIGLGARTTGNGIPVVQNVRGGTSAPTAFALAQPVQAGLHGYGLVQQADGQWYLVAVEVPSAPTLERPSDGATVGTTPTLAGSADPGTSVEVSVDGSVVCTAETDPHGHFECQSSEELAVGDHQTTAVATSPAGHTSPTSEAIDFAVAEGVVPSAPVITSPVEGSQLNTAEIAIGGKAEPGSTVVVQVDGEEVCEVVADPEGDWACSVALGEGHHEASATATNETGTGEPSTVIGFEVDRTGPTGLVINEPEVGDEGVTFSGTAEPGTVIEVEIEEVEVEIDGVLACTDTSDVNGSWGCAAPVPAGTHEVVVVATDSAGNTTRSDPFVLRIKAGAGIEWSLAGGRSGCSTAAGTATMPWLIPILAAGGLLRRRHAKQRG